MTKNKDNKKIIYLNYKNIIYTNLFMIKNYLIIMVIKRKIISNCKFVYIPKFFKILYSLKNRYLLINLIFQF